MKPSAERILRVLEARPGEWVSALDFKRGTFGFTADAVSQRASELRALGFPVESTGRGGVASYRITPTFREEVRSDGLRQLAIV